MHNLNSFALWIRLLPKKYSHSLGFRYILFRFFCEFVGGSCEVGSNWVSNCSWKPSKLLLPPLEGAMIVNGDTWMSISSGWNGAGWGSEVGEISSAQVDDFIATTFCIAAIDNSLPWVIINTLCLKERRFLESDACAMVEQLAALTCALMTRAGVGDVGRQNRKHELKAISCNDSLYITLNVNNRPNKIHWLWGFWRWVVCVGAFM